MNNQPKRKRGLLTSLAAVATAALMALSAAPAQANTSPVTIDTSKTGTIIVHKFEQPNTIGKPSTGLPQETTGTPMNGITFSAQRVNDVDLTTNEGWAEAGRLTAVEAAGQLTGDVYKDTTDADGLATISELPLGLYYVSETFYGADVTPAAPFLVTLPMTHPTELNTWLYDVHVYPKNATTKIAKTVDDAATVTIGEEVKWTILADIPKAQLIDMYTIVDKLDYRLEFVTAAVSLTGDTGVTLTEGAEGDFTVVEDPAKTVTVKFTDVGRAKLATVWTTYPNAQVEVVITTKVLKVGEIENTATVYPNSTSEGVTTNQVTTKFGNIVLDKVAADSGEKLDKAEFQVFLTKADAKAKTNAISIEDVSVFKSDTNGMVLIEGLRYSNWENGEEVLKGADNYRSYWIAETKAPEGYELLAEPIEVDVASFEETVSVEVKNVPKNAGFVLPLTGASGASAIIMVAGLLLLVVGTTAVVVSRRKRGQAQA